MNKKVSGFSKSSLSGLYSFQKKSASEIARAFKCSEGRINYWIKKFGIQKRTISEAVYARKNPKGDPFFFSPPKNIKEAELFGTGIGLYWGEGNKANKNAVKIGNSDPELMNVFIKFLEKFFGIKRKDCRFHLHIFSDIDKNEALNYWAKQLNLKKSQFYKSTTTKTGKLGTYRKKSKYGVLSLYYLNTKLRNLVVSFLRPR